MLQNLPQIMQYKQLIFCNCTALIMSIDTPYSLIHGLKCTRLYGWTVSGTTRANLARCHQWFHREFKPRSPFTYDHHTRHLYHLHPSSSSSSISLSVIKIFVTSLTLREYDEMKGTTKTNMGIHRSVGNPTKSPASHENPNADNTEKESHIMQTHQSST